MRKKSFWLGLMIAAFLAGGTGMAHAIPTTSDMQLNGSYADAVAGPIAGNDDVAAINNLNGLFAGNDWTFITKDDAPGSGTAATGSFGGILFSVTASSGTSGTWDLTWSSSDLPVQIDLVAVLKGGNHFAAFLFDNERLTGAGTNTPDDPWEITFINGGGNIPDLSHLSLYGRDRVPLNDPVPEPATMLLMGTGLAGLVAVRRRTARKTE